MKDDVTRKTRREIGERIRKAREELNDEKRTLKWFCEAVGGNLSESLLSQMESGSRPISSDLLLRIANVTGVSPHELLSGRGEKPVQIDFQPTVQFLEQAQRLGVKALGMDRDAALFDLLPFLNGMYTGEVNITGSSLKGLQQDSNHEFIKKLIEVARDRPKIAVRTLMTHPKYGYTREFLENRISGSIVSEIFQGIRWGVGILEIPPENIKFVKASPTCFSIFLWNGREGVGFVNPYPLMKQAFTCFSLTVRSVDRPDAQGGRAQSIYQSLSNANFHTPWEDTSGNITVPLSVAIDECTNGKDKDELLRREAVSLNAFLTDKKKKESVKHIEAAPPTKRLKQSPVD